ncbi:hypothetical protein PCANC_19541 [Puccinia coronata f. sp. avenae]|uniref:Ecp2 effector protein domain-containing protein n=1 Tax=Puccinia coronata f. sp. avenae TaxID=200324 RepID=A0A2N5TQ86_9BASI|nr:hypothetical protein PCANC_19541 [Puccinia coronata f. sp. avenae]
MLQAYHLVLMLFIALLLPSPGFPLPAGDSSDDAIPLTPICDADPNRKVSPTNCVKALSLIKYNSDATLDTWESHVERVYGDCVVAFDRPLVPHDFTGKTSPTPITKTKLERQIHLILSTCKGVAGTVPESTLQGVLLIVRPRGDTPIYEDDFPPNEIVCGQTVQNDDCMRAYDNIRKEPTGRPSLNGADPSNSVHATFGTCKAELFTSDGTIISLLKDDLKPKFQQMNEHCHGKTSTMTIDTGADGMNGRLFLRTVPA